jgi:hypothetical protein
LDILDTKHTDDTIKRVEKILQDDLEIRGMTRGPTSVFKAIWFGFRKVIDHQKMPFMA